MSRLLINILYNRIHLIIPALLLVVFSTTKNFNSPYDKVIASDVVGYYAYLPAIFIYNDLGFEFTKEISDKYYVDGRAGKYEFINYYKSKPVNKYWIGLSILWLPFFILAYLLSLIFGVDADGYNNFYQYIIGFANCTYLSIGIYFFKKNLKSFGFSRLIIIISTIAIILGTNILYYSVVEPGHSHIYSFTFLSCFIALIIKIKNEETLNYKSLLAAIIAATIVCIIRPLNIFLILFSVLLIFNFKEFRKLIDNLLINHKKIILVLLVPLFLIAIQIVLWQLQTGFWFVDSYAGEKFNLNNSHFFDYLISYKKGWLTYTPICFFSFTGIIIFYNKEVSKIALATSLLITWVFLLSSWWIWTYGTSFGQRLMIDSLAILGVFITATIAWLHRSSKYVCLTIVTFLIFLNCFQTWQQKNGILPSYFVTKNIYWQSFLNPNKNSYALYSDDLIIEKKVFQFKVANHKILATNNHINTAETSVSKNNIYSASLIECIPENFLYGITKLIFEARIGSSQNETNASIVFDISRNNKNVFYQKFDLKEYLENNKYKKMEFQIDLPNNLFPKDSIKIYLYNQTIKDDIVSMSNMKLTYLRMRKDE